MHQHFRTSKSRRDAACLAFKGSAHMCALHVHAEHSTPSHAGGSQVEAGGSRGAGSAGAEGAPQKAAYQEQTKSTSCCNIVSIALSYIWGLDVGPVTICLPC